MKREREKQMRLCLYERSKGKREREREKIIDSLECRVKAAYFRFGNEKKKGRESERFKRNQKEWTLRNERTEDTVTSKMLLTS